jgi:hypothetical protein
VFGNTIDGNQSAAVMLVSYTQDYADTTYDPLPRDITVRDNKIGRNGFDPQIEGGKALAAAFGGALPPVMWDGVTDYVRKGATEPEAARVHITDGPVLNLHLARPGALLTAKPEVTATIDGGSWPEPTPVVLPKGQAGL